nr:hypothetical protein [Elizabethkingia sp. ASV34]
MYREINMLKGFSILTLIGFGYAYRLIIVILTNTETVHRINK